MAKCHPTAAVSSSGDVSIGSLLLDHHSHHRRRSDHLRLWKSSFRRVLLDALSCGGSSLRYDDVFPSQCSSASTSSAAAPPPPRQRTGKSEKLSDLLSVAEAETESETKKKVEALEEMMSVVRDLQLEEENGETLRRRREAARRVRSLAKEDSYARVTLAMLGAIPPLVGMLDSVTADCGPNDDVECRVASLYAILNLGIGNDANKAAIVKAGAVHKMLKIIDSPDSPEPCVTEAIVANFLGLSALDSNKPIIGSSGAIPFLVNFLKNNRSSSQARNDALRALYNLSIYPQNISFILDTDLIPFLINTLGDMEVSERILSILSNVVPVPEGRNAISSNRDAFPILVDVLNWTDSPGCQEKVSYILMVMAHKTYGDRQAMISAGVASTLLELTLLGSTLAQKRASRILECLRVDKGKQVSESYGGNSSAAVSAPIYGSSSSTNPGMISKECLEESEDMMSDEKKAVKQLVQQSLQTNMRRIVKRANLPQDFIPSEHFKSLTASSTSKSLPF